MEECRSDRSIAQCGAAGGEIRRGGVAHALTLSRPHATPITFFNSRTQARERESAQKYSTVQYNTAKSHSVRIGNGQWRGVTRPPHCFSRLPRGRQSYSRLTASLAMQLSIPKPRTKAEMFENTVASPHHTSHIDQYSKTCEKVLLRLIDYLVLSAMLQIPPSSERSPPFRTGIPPAPRSRRLEVQERKVLRVNTGTGIIVTSNR
jgi:hypothetical protein